MTYAQIMKMQKEKGFSEMQSMINNGSVWKLEGSTGREAMALLEQGVCMLPNVAYKDYCGNIVPARNMLKSGTKGTFQNAQKYWESVSE